MKKLTLLFWGFAFLFFIGCKKGTPVVNLTEPTQIGANTLSAVMDGSVMVAKSSFLEKSPDVGYYGKKNGVEKIIISGSNLLTFPKKSIVIVLQAAELKPGTYELDRNITLDNTVDVGGRGGYAIRAIDAPDFTDYETSSQYKGKITFSRVDLVEKIFSGTFAFTAVNANGKTVSISDGRFDLKQTP